MMATLQKKKTSKRKINLDNVKNFVFICISDNMKKVKYFEGLKNETLSFPF
jgi:hypothetical protein